MYDRMVKGLITKLRNKLDEVLHFGLKWNLMGTIIYEGFE